MNHSSFVELVVIFIETNYRYGGSFKIVMILKTVEKRAMALQEVQQTFPSAALLTTNETSAHLFWRVRSPSLLSFFSLFLSLSLSLSLFL